MTSPLPSKVRPGSRRITGEAFSRAMAAAGQAPSAHHAQPWRWRVEAGVLDLLADSGRMAGSTDPQGRLATISCGAALHHARVALAAQGWRVSVTRMPDAADPAFLARLRIDKAAPVSPDTADLARAIPLQRTDARPITGGPVSSAHLGVLTAAFEAQQVSVAVLRPEQILALTVATAHADNTGPADAQWQAATFVVLHGPQDRRLDWLHAGEALSAGSLVGTGLGVSIEPFSAPIEHTEARETLRRAVQDLCFPYLMMRLGHHATPHLTAAEGMPRPS